MHPLATYKSRNCKCHCCAWHISNLCKTAMFYVYWQQSQFYSYNLAFTLEIHELNQLKIYAKLRFFFCEQFNDEPIKSRCKIELNALAFIWLRIYAHCALQWNRDHITLRCEFVSRRVRDWTVCVQCDVGESIMWREKIVYRLCSIVFRLCKSQRISKPSIDISSISYIHVHGKKKQPRIQIIIYFLGRPLINMEIAKIPQSIYHLTAWRKLPSRTDNLRFKFVSTNSNSRSLEHFAKHIVCIILLFETNKKYAYALHSNYQQMRIIFCFSLYLLCFHYSLPSINFTQLFCFLSAMQVWSLFALCGLSRYQCKLEKPFVLKSYKFVIPLQAPGFEWNRIRKRYGIKIMLKYNGN